jgi:hypothetical protein
MAVEGGEQKAELRDPRLQQLRRYCRDGAISEEQEHGCLRFLPERSPLSIVPV